MRPRYLKNIGRVTLSVLSHAGEGKSTIRETIEERRRQMRDVVRERLAVRASAADAADDEG